MPRQPKTASTAAYSQCEKLQRHPVRPAGAGRQAGRHRRRPNRAGRPPGHHRQLETIKDLTEKATANQRAEQHSRELENRSEKQQAAISELKKRVKTLQKALKENRKEQAVPRARGPAASHLQGKADRPEWAIQHSKETVAGGGAGLSTKAGS